MKVSIYNLQCNHDNYGSTDLSVNVIRCKDDRTRRNTTSLMYILILSFVSLVYWILSYIFINIVNLYTKIGSAIVSTILFVIFIGIVITNAIKRD